MDFVEFIENEKKKINENYLGMYFNNFIKNESEVDLQKILRSGNEFLLTGGRRLLPICLIQTFKGLASDKDLNQYYEEIYHVSISIELLHISSLIIEDIVDQESHRGENKSVQFLIRNIIENEFPNKSKRSKEIERKIDAITNASTIYEGNIISLLGFEIINKSNFPSRQKQKAIKIFQTGLINISRGRLLNEYYKLMDLDKISLETYLILAGMKRGSQRATAAGLGAALGNARTTQWEPLMEAMNKIGIIEQLINDINGIEEDIRSGQASLLPIIAFQTASNEQRKILNSILGKINASEEDIAKVRGIYEGTGAIEFIHHYANSLKNDAYNQLLRVYPGLRENVMDFFEQLLTYIISYQK